MRCLVGPLLLIAACSGPVEGNGPAVASPVRRSADVSGCEAGASADGARDVLGWRWLSDESGWCRHSPDGTKVERWVHDFGGSATHLLRVEGRHAAMTETVPRLMPVPAAAAAPLANCPRTPRSEIFLRQNWLYRPGDLDCGTFRGDGYTIRAEFLPVPGGPLPAIVSRPLRQANGTIILVRGGPYRSVLRGLGANAITIHLLARYGAAATISIPTYVGTDPIRYGADSLRRAEAELGEILSEASTPTCLLATSMGAFAAASLIGNHPDVRFLLVAPLASSPDNFVARARSAGVPATRRSLTDLEAGSPRPISPPEDEAYLEYFGEAGARTLRDRLGPAAGGDNWEILFSPQDEVIGQDAINHLRAEFGGRIRATPGGGHAIEDAFNAAAYVPGIDAFVDRCLQAARP